MKSTPTLRPSDLDCAYLAGIIDGEGCITASVISRWRPDGTRHNWTEIQPLVTVTNTAPELIEWIGDLWPVHTKTMKRQSATHKTTWRVQVQGRDLPGLLADVQPYLIVKQRQAALMTDLLSLRRRAGNWYYTEETQARRLEIVRQMQELNRPVPEQRRHDRRTGPRRPGPRGDLAAL